MADQYSGQIGRFGLRSHLLFNFTGDHQPDDAVELIVPDGGPAVTRLQRVFGVAAFNLNPSSRDFVTSDYRNPAALRFGESIRAAFVIPQIISENKYRRDATRRRIFFQFQKANVLWPPPHPLPLLPPR